MTFIDDFYDNPSLYITHTELMNQRALFALNYAFTGYGKTFDEAMSIIQEADTFDWTQKQIAEREMLINLVDNLINFSVAEEHQMLADLMQDKEDSDNKEAFISLATSTFSKYNKQYSSIENGDIFFALAIAAQLATINDNEIITFTTQGDERVRASHAAFDGLRYRKKDFPPALIPPIEHGCRCYLINTKSTDGRILTNKPNIDELIGKLGGSTFKNNVATSGILFSEEHPYFNIPSENTNILQSTARKIKRKLGIS